jgi:OTU domain-containing protein 6
MNQLREMELNSGPTQRQVELESINNHLKPYNLAVKEIISDGHCLYRAIADQLHCDSETDFVTLRKLAADHIRNNSDSYLPFINSECSGSFDDYCRYINILLIKIILKLKLIILCWSRQVEDLSGAVWGGQIEIRALCESLHRPIYVFSSDSPILKMGQEESGDVIYLTYHRHYYALGAHYNSTQPLHTNI